MATNNRYPVSVVMDLSATASIPQDRSMVTWNGRRFIIEPFTSPHTVFNGSVHLDASSNPGYIGSNRIVVGHSNYGFNYPSWDEGGNYVQISTTLNIENINCALPIPYDISSNDIIQVKGNLYTDSTSITYHLYLLQYYNTCSTAGPISVDKYSVFDDPVDIDNSSTYCFERNFTGITYSTSNDDMIGVGIDILSNSGPSGNIKLSYIVNIYNRNAPGI